MVRSPFGTFGILAGLMAMGLSVAAPGANAAPPTTATWKPVGDATSGFSTAVMRWDHAGAKRYLTDGLREQADRSSVHRMLGIKATPHRYWYWVNTFDGTRAHVTLAHYFPDGRKPVTNDLEWTRVGTSWRIAKITRVAAAVPAPAEARKAVGNASQGLGHAVIHGDDAAINHYATSDLLKRAPAGHLVNLLGMQNIPGSFAYTIDSAWATGATVTMRWMFGHLTVVDRLNWVKTEAGWRIANVKVVST